MSRREPRNRVRRRARGGLNAILRVAALTAGDEKMAEYEALGYVQRGADGRWELTDAYYASKGL